MATIPKGFGTIEDLLNRASQAQKHWELWRSLHQEAFDFAAPQRDTMQYYSPGQRKNRHVFDSTAIEGLATFANRIQGSLMPSWKKWMMLTAGQAVPKNERKRVDTALEAATNTFFSFFNHSNFTTEITPGLSDLGIGTGAILVEEAEFSQGNPIKFSNVPLAELHPEMPPSGPIECVWRPQEIEARHIKRLWPDADLPESVARLAETKPLTKVKILNGMLYNPDDKRYYQMVIHKSSKTLIFTQNFATKRLIVFRWHVTPGEVFGRGPILQKLADIRTANKVKQFILENAAIQMAGVYTGVDDGVFNPHTVRIAPGVIIPVTSNASQAPTLQALPRAGDIGIGGIVLEDLQASIKRSLMADPMGEVTDTVKSATEQMLRMQESLKERGASFGRLKSELMEPIVTAVVDILTSLGHIEDIKIDGRAATIRWESPLARAEDVDDFQNSQMWLATIGQLPEGIALGSIKLEELPEYWAGKLGVPLSLLRDDTEKQQLTAMAMEAAQAMLQAGGTPGQGGMGGAGI